MQLDSAQLNAFSAVIDEGSFERAAAVLHITRSAVSQRIKLLEERVGQVLVRRATPCTATEAGQALYRHAREIALSEADALAAIGGARAAPRAWPSASMPTRWPPGSRPPWRRRGRPFHHLRHPCGRPGIIRPTCCAKAA